MRITVRLVIVLVVAMSIVGGLWAWWSVQAERDRLTMDLEHRAWLVAEGLKDTARAVAEKGPSEKIERRIEKISAERQVMGITVYSPEGEALYLSPGLAGALPPKVDLLFEKFEGEAGKGAYQKVGAVDAYLYALPLFGEEGGRAGTLVIFSNASYVEDYLYDVWKRNFIRLLIQAFVISLITVIVIRLSIVGPIARMAEWMKGVRRGEFEERFEMPKEDLFAPLSKEISSMAKSLVLARARAEEDARSRQRAESVWTRERLREHVKAKMGERRLIVVSNREPYIHRRSGRKIECIRPASGLITALEPVLRVSGGLWIAHGVGDADRETVGARNIIRVPPENPQYDLKRVWLTTEEEQGYYYGFANEGLWPLCHIAHTRPAFRVGDWAMYQEVNFKFSRNVDEDIRGESYVFIQDYHFALLPRIVKNRHPDAKVAIFWHIPWPNPEAFGICPWKREILHGMLGADLIGFHTQFHCNNFLETVDRTLECRIDWEHFTASRAGHTTHVKPFPISIDFPVPPPDPQAATKDAIFKNLGVSASLLGVGVDRVDYTKGIIERFLAIERFLDKNPEYRGMFAFVQIGAPSREHIKRYHDLLGEVSAEADRINWKFQSGGWKPIVFIRRHLSHEEIAPYYRAADACLVTSLHDGMNLVAKEFVAARDDELGALILSTFAGASKELRDALLVNPYDIEQMADAIKAALEMDVEEQAQRMRRMRSVVRENNIYKWAADIVTELAQIRIPEQA